MSATCVDTVPGGLLDALRAAGPLPAGLDALAAGRAREAATEIGRLPPSPLRDAWLYLAGHAAVLALPDGGALPLIDLVDPRPTPPAKPAAPDAGDPDAAVCWAIVELCVGLRDLRAILPPLMPAEVLDLEATRGQAQATLDRGRDVVATWPALAPHLDLVAADLASRAGATAEAWQALDSAREGFERLGDVRGAAAAALVTGDWHAAPFASPVTWGLALDTPTGVDGGLARSTEDGEHGAPCDVASATAAYDTAQRLYAAAGDARGLAHVAWRRAYLAAQGGRPDVASGLAEDARAQLAAAGDGAAALLADAHARLAALADGRLPDPAEAAAPVLEWARGPGSLSHAIAVGRLYARTGRAWASRGTRRCELSLSASEVALEIWTGLDRSGARSQTLADQAHALTVLGAGRQAMLTLEAAFDLTAARFTAGRPIDGTWPRAALLGASLYNLANAAADPDAMERAVRRLAPLSAAARAALGAVGPHETWVAEQVIAVDSMISGSAVGLAYRAQAARDAGDAGAATELFAQAETAALRADPGERDQMLAFVRAFARRLDEAAALFRPWLAARLAEIEELRDAGLPRFTAALALQAERQVRSQAVFFSLRTGDVATAREQLDILTSLADPWWEDLGHPWEHEDAVGRLLEAEGDLDAALEAFRRAVTAAEAVRADLRRDDLKVAFGASSTVQALYRNAARVALRRRERALADGSPDEAGRHGREALRLLELGRSRALTDLVTEASRTAGGRPSHALPPDLLTAWRGAQAEVALCRDRLAAAVDADARDPALVTALRDALSTAEAELEARVDELRALDPRFWQLSGHRGSVDWDPGDLITALAPGEAVLVLSIDRPDLVACGVTGEGIVTATWSQEERRVDAIARRLVAACAAGTPWQDPARELAEILLEPLGAALEGARRVHVVASGPTLAVPFGVLPWRGSPLAEQVALSVLPAMSVFTLLGAAGRRQRALCVGDPAGMAHAGRPGDAPTPAIPLPGAAAEARAVAREYGVRPLVGPDATEAAVRARLLDADVVHLATHGLVDPVSSLASSLLLAQGEELTVAELLSMRLSADLVVLSACQTGTGRPVGGDELLGLGRALLAAGARSAVVTLWPVDDVTTAVFMAQFHRLLLAGESAAGALKGAVARLRELDPAGVQAEYAALTAPAPPAQDAVRAISAHAPQRAPGCPPDHPNRWAPFVLVGR